MIQLCIHIFTAKEPLIRRDVEIQKSRAHSLWQQRPESIQGANELDHPKAAHVAEKPFWSRRQQAVTDVFSANIPKHFTNWAKVSVLGKLRAGVCGCHSPSAALAFIQSIGYL